MTNKRNPLTVACHTCGDTHPAEYSHKSPYGGHAVYAVVCTLDYLTDYYTEEAIR